MSRLALEKIRKMQLDEEERTKELNERITAAEREQSEAQVGEEWKGRTGKLGKGDAEAVGAGVTWHLTAAVVPT